MKLYACGYNLNGQITQSTPSIVKTPWSLLETWNSRLSPCVETKDPLVAFGFSYIATCCGNQVRIKGFDNKFNQVITLPDEKYINTNDRIKSNNKPNETKLNHIISISVCKTNILIIQANGIVWNLNVASSMKSDEQNQIKTDKKILSEVNLKSSENLTKGKVDTLHSFSNPSPDFTIETKSDKTLLEIDKVKQIPRKPSNNIGILDCVKLFENESMSKLKINKTDKYAGNTTAQIDSEQMEESSNSRIECQQDTAETNHSEDEDKDNHLESVLSEQLSIGLTNIDHLFSCELDDIRDEHISCVHEDELMSTDEDSNEMKFNYKKRRTKSPLLSFNRDHIKKCVSTDNIQLLLSEQGQVFHLSGRMDCFIGQVVVDIACGFDHCLALTQDGLVYSWGNGSRGQLGYPVNSCDEDHTAGLDTSDPNHGTGLDTSDPREVRALSGLGIVQVVAGGWHSVARTREGILYAWGWNNSGQLGIKDKVDQVVYDPHPVSWPEDIDPNEKHIDSHSEDIDPNEKHIDSHSEDIDPNEKHIDSHSEDIDPNEKHIDSHFEDIDPNEKHIDPHSEEFDPNEKHIDSHSEDIDYQDVKIIDIACGARHTLALGDDGSVWGCGWNEYGQLRSNTKDEEEVPKVCTMTRLPIPDKVVVLKLYAGHWNSVLVTD